MGRRWSGNAGFSRRTVIYLGSNLNCGHFYVPACTSAVGVTGTLECVTNELQHGGSVLYHYEQIAWKMQQLGVRSIEGRIRDGLQYNFSDAC